MMKMQTILTLALLCICSTSVQAQPGRGPGGPGFGRGAGGTSGLLAMKEVQTEVKLTEEQQEQYKTLMEELRPARPEFPNFRELSEEERTKAFEDMRKKAEESSKKIDDAVKGILKSEQWKRLGELRLQREGVASFQRTEIAEQLKLTDEQKTKIKEITEGMRPTRGTEGQRPSFTDFQKKREQAQKDMLDALTSSQKEAWEKMQGEKFKFPETQFQRPGSNTRPAE